MRAVVKAAVTASAFLIGALAVSLAPQSRSAASIVPINLQGPEGEFVAAFLAAGTPPQALVSSPTAPFLPGGERALATVRGDSGYRGDERLVVTDSAAELTFAFDKPAQRRLQVVARAGDAQRARTLADAAATRYVRARRIFFAAQIQRFAPAPPRPRRRAPPVSPVDQAAGDLARRELSVLGRPAPAVAIDRAATPSPLRAGVVMGLVGLIAVRLVGRRRLR